MATITNDDFRRDRRNGATDRRMNSYSSATAPAAAGVVPTVIASTTDGMRVSWGGIWGGVLSAVGIMLLLAALGVAIGVSATDPQSADAGTLGTAAGIYAVASMLIALFVGGMVATRIGAIHDRATGFWEGALVWVVSVLLLAYLAASGVSGLVGGAFSMLGSASQSMGALMQQDPNAANQASSKLGQLRDRMQQQMDSGAMQQRGEELKAKAAEAKPAATKAAWVTFAGFVLSLAAAIVGALVGRRRHPVPLIRR